MQRMILRGDSGHFRGVGYETKKGRLVVKIVNHYSNFRRVMFCMSNRYQK